MQRLINSFTVAFLFCLLVSFFVCTDGNAQNNPAVGARPSGATSTGTFSVISNKEEKRPGIYRYHETNLYSYQKELYKLISEALFSLDHSIKLPASRQEDIRAAYGAVLLDYPEIFYTRSYKCAENTQKKEVVCRPDYLFSPSDIRRFQKDIAMSLSFFQNVKYKSDYEKVKYVHDFILNNIKYDKASAHPHSVLGIVYNKKAVCEGIAKYMKLALDSLGVKSIVVTGIGVNPTTSRNDNEDHAWNMVMVNGGWYHVDATYDLGLKHQINRYDYFLIKDSEIQKDHFTKMYLPRSGARTMDYYSASGLTVADLSELGAVISRSLRSGNRVMQFKLVNVPSGVDVEKAMMQIAQDEYKNLWKHTFGVRLQHNKDTHVVEIEFNQAS